MCPLARQPSLAVSLSSPWFPLAASLGLLPLKRSRGTRGWFQVPVTPVPMAPLSEVLIFTYWASEQGLFKESVRAERHVKASGLLFAAWCPEEVLCSTLLIQTPRTERPGCHGKPTPGHTPFRTPTEDFFLRSLVLLTLKRASCMMFRWYCGWLILVLFTFI